ncbi:MAG: hypothetical protein P8P20_15105, partial [Acidimicrobiales bacterium]|nr:hypothetical protein [Acidimicrobiales bacterium]
RCGLGFLGTDQRVPSQIDPVIAQWSRLTNRSATECIPPAVRRVFRARGRDRMMLQHVATAPRVTTTSYDS